MFIGDATAFIVALIAQFAGVENELGWSTVATYLLLAMGFGYFRTLGYASLAHVSSQSGIAPRGP